MIVAVLFILVMIALLGWPSSVYLFSQFRNRPLTDAAADLDRGDASPAPRS